MGISRDAGAAAIYVALMTCTGLHYRPILFCELRGIT